MISGQSCSLSANKDKSAITSEKVYLTKLTSKGG